MCGELPPPVPRSEDDEDELLFGQPPPRQPWRRWVIAGLIAAGVLGLAAVGMLLYLGAAAWQRQIGPYNTGVAPATRSGVGRFARVTRFGTRADVQGLGGGDVDGDGEGEAVVWVGKDLTIRDRAGRQENSFASGLKAIDRSAAAGTWMPALPGGGGRRPLVATLGGRPAIVATDGEGDTVYAYRADGARVLTLTVANSHIRCLTVADLDGDGQSEVLAGRSSAVGLVCSDGLARTRWKYGSATDPAWVCVGDGNADGKPDVFVGYDTGAVHILDPEGKRIGQWPHWIPSVSTQCADLDGDQRADLLLSRPQNTAATGVPPGAGQGNPYAGLGLGSDLIGVAADGTQRWTWPLAATGLRLSMAHLGQGDLNLDGKGEWIASAPDGTVRVYDVVGNELGTYALGEEVQTLAVVPGRAGEKPQVWVSLGRDLVVLEWQ